MRFRSRALALLGALAFFLAGTGAHGHAETGPGLEKPCAVCAFQAQGVAACTNPVAGPAPAPQLSTELPDRAPSARETRTDGSAAPRGPPLTY